jgi:GMP synthase (glutamine-hydrolysing)
VSERVLVVDFGSQVTQLIARRVREHSVYCEIVPWHRAADRLDPPPGAIILSGGPDSVAAEAAPSIPPEIFRSGVPVLGICYGQQAMVVALGGRVSAAQTREFGRADIEVSAPSALFEGLWQPGERHPVWMSHGDRVEAVPDGFRAVARTDAAPFAAIADERRRYFGVQFHPEVVHTPDGSALLRRFVRDVAGLDGSWSVGRIRTEAVARIRAQVGDGRVICGLSGGVDSAVAARLVHEAVGERLTCVFVDHGLLRANEAAEVEATFRQRFNIALRTVDAEERFLAALEGVEEPEAKRKTIGRVFVEEFEVVARDIGADFLAQGTLYPDVIESVAPSGSPSVTIKSHHNVGGLPERMQMQVVEPLRELFKDEVRELGRELGLPESLVGRHPFPGPGLAIRIPGAVTRSKISLLREADRIYLDAIRRAGLYDDIWQAFAVLLPVRSVGVMGDRRSYDYALALRAVTSLDGMTASVYPFSADFLAEVATTIVNRLPGINRVLYDVTSKPPGTIEWE